MCDNNADHLADGVCDADAHDETDKVCGDDADEKNISGEAKSFGNSKKYDNNNALHVENVGNIGDSIYCYLADEAMMMMMMISISIGMVVLVIAMLVMAMLVMMRVMKTVMMAMTDSRDKLVVHGDKTMRMTALMIARK